MCLFCLPRVGLQYPEALATSQSIASILNSTTIRNRIRIRIRLETKNGRGSKDTVHAVSNDRTGCTREVSVYTPRG